MSFYAGIDGGQSSTVALIGDAAGVLGRGSGPPADLVGEARGSGRQAAALDAALTRALEAAGLDGRTRFETIVAGISGFDVEHSDVPDLSARTGRLRVVHDTEIAHAGALDGRPGIVLIAGTGSVALGNDERAPERFVRAGGWGYFFGDEGSALSIARTALRRAMLRSDRAEKSELAACALTFFGATSLRAIQHAFAHGELERPALAAFASDVLRCAGRGDADAEDVCGAAAMQLAVLAALVDRRLAPALAGGRLVSYAGGLFEDAPFIERFGDALTAAMPHARLVQAAHEPAWGALACARTLR